MYKLKNVAKRGSALLGAVGLLTGIGTSALPAFASADALNPLTERSLTLSSSSPGWAYTDGSGNSTYAPPNSGANGQKTGNYFSFKVSSTATVKTFSFQYCTKSAGICLIPGDDSPRGTDVAGASSDLNVAYPSATEVDGTETTSTPTISLVSGTPTVTGSGTTFMSDFVNGGTFKTAGGNVYTIKSIFNDTQLTLTTDATATETGVTYKTSDFLQVVDPSTGLVKAVPGYTNHNQKYSGSGDPAEAAKNVAGNFIVMYKSGGSWVESTGWAAASHQVDDVSDPAAGSTDKNYITLTNASGVALTADQQVKVLFFANDTNFITNPGEGAFFVKINTYNVPFEDSATPTAPAVNLDGLAPVGPTTNIIDGGVTVANVMNQSIQITTKVLETMKFSVGTVDPDTLTDAQLAASDNGTNKHQNCDEILTRLTSGATVPKDVLQLGDQGSESSLDTEHTYATHSYWRLSSNSSAGATVYYSGHTLANTSGDEIQPIGKTAAISAPGSEQFGLALDTYALNGTTGVPRLDSGAYGVDYSTAGAYENGADNTAAGVIAAGTDPLNINSGVDDSVLTDRGADLVAPDYSGLNKSYHTPKLDPLVPTDGSNGTTNYGSGAGFIDGDTTPADNHLPQAQFAFDPMSDTVPAAIATENNQVVDCVTGKMRYIANIAATTPAGIYTTKVNYIAAPQY